MKKFLITLALFLFSNEVSAESVVFIYELAVQHPNGCMYIGGNDSNAYGTTYTVFDTSSKKCKPLFPGTVLLCQITKVIKEVKNKTIESTYDAQGTCREK
jgi:hypothetical protein